MREMIAGKADAGKRLDKWVTLCLPGLPMGQVQKYIRLKRVKVNGKAAPMNARLQEGDAISLYLDETCFDASKPPDKLLSRFTPHITVLYEDEQLLIVDKQPGLLCHPDEMEKVNTLLTHVRAYLYQKGGYDSRDPNAFSPVLCNRIDRFTGGIVLIARTEEAMRALNQKIRDHEVEKRYLLAAVGRMLKREGVIDNYLFKPEGAKRVQVLHEPVPGAKRAITKYRTLAFERGLSLIECELVTGRTHQIRAQFAGAGCPLAGDTQYGDRAANERLGMSAQALYAYRIDFPFRTDAGVLRAIQGKCFTVKSVRFVETLFPNDPHVNPS